MLQFNYGNEKKCNEDGEEKKTKQNMMMKTGKEGNQALNHCKCIAGGTTKTRCTALHFYANFLR